MKPIVSLKTLSQYSKQAVFDHVAEHLFAQNKQCSDITFGRCRYFHNGLRCAAGCLIAEDEYTPGFENKSWETLIRHNLVPEDHFELIVDLQRVHDLYKPNTWLRQLYLVAQKHALIWNYEVI